MGLLFPSNKIYTATSSIEGLGVFAREDIHPGEVIEECPVIEIPGDQLSNLTKTKLLEYYFAWQEGFKQGAVCLGFGSLYNHSYEPNARYIKSYAEKVIRFVALRKINREEEIVVNYNGHPEDKTKLWFLARKTLPG